MKKIYIMIMLVFAGVMAVAQTSVWNGDRTLWTRGSGTESDPYLLESAEHLAYFAYVVNKGFNTTGMHFLLTTDIDLNGSEDLPWVPIGLGDRWFSEDGCNRGSSSGFYDRRPFFQGHFDGGNHSVSNIYVDGWSNAGLFGWAQGTVENPTVIENVFVLSGTIAGATCGGILGKGTNTLVSHCWNGASISGTNVGGIVGEGANVLSCYNTGHVTGTANVGGIVGQSALVIEECYNSGIVEGDGQVAAGGLLGRDYPVASTINNCYNTGTVSALGGEGSYYPAAGGLIGRQVKSCEITNCYNVGEVSGSNHVGCLIGLSSTAASVENCYYLDACTESEYGTASSGDYMRSQELVDILNSGNTDPVWALDSDGINNGFPVLLNFVSAGSNVTDGVLNGLFSVGENTTVCFSQGNLQYIGSAGNGDDNNTGAYWKFAEHQWESLGDNGQGSDSKTVDRDLFGWGTSGYNHGANCYQPWSISGTYSDYYAYGNSGYNLFDQSGQADWGYNAISNGGNQENSGWRTLTQPEWDYVFNTRTMVNGGPRYTLGRRVEGVLGVVVYPDNYAGSVVSSDLTAEGWAEYEAAGCAFLPAAGYRYGASVGNVGSVGYYWSASYLNSGRAWYVYFGDTYLGTDDYSYRDYGFSVRLARVAENYSFNINATPNPAEGGTVSGAGAYAEGAECTLTATASAGYTFVNWTENGEVVSTDPTYLFTVNGDRELMANFNPQQYTAFNTGWTWYSTFVELNDINGLEMMEDGLGDNGVMIKSQQNGFVMYDLGEWMGALTSMNNESMYLINVNTPCSVVFNGMMADPAQHPITLAPGWNWIGYPSAVAADINTALANLQPHEGDVVKTQEAFSQYSEELGWMGGLNTLTPGDGLMYRSLNNQTMNFVYVTESKDGVLKKNITHEDSHFVPAMNAYPYNMSVMAVVEFDNQELRDSRYELAAFVGDECRGSVKLHYVKALDRYVAFLTVAGDKAATLRWKLYDTVTDKTYANDDEAVFEADAVMGGVKSPVTMRFNSVTAQTGEWLSSTKIWPNPVKAGETIRIDLPSNSRHATRVEVVNALGVVVNTVTLNDTSITLKAPMVPGLYLVRVTSEEGECHGFKLIVK